MNNVLTKSVLRVYDMMKNLPIYLFSLLLLSACVSSPQPMPTEKKKTIEVIRPSTPTPSKIMPPPPVVEEKPVYTPPPPPIQEKPVYTPPPPPAELSKKIYPSFAEWKADFTNRAISAGHQASDVQRLLGSAQLNQQVISLDGRQPEFSKMPWEYADSAVAGSRVQQGKKNFANQRSLLSGLEARYGVPASIVTAIWGMESSYGQGTGNTSLSSALATLAYDGRRREFAEEQLLALLTLLQQGDVSWSHLKGSWAGGMGHTQFIPKTWLQQGVDGDNDGRKNPWAMADALSSTANYLSNAGWERGLSPFYEVRLPTSFDFIQSGTQKTLAEWRSQGVQLLGNSTLADSIPLELWLPAGSDGPALLLSKNFQVIKVYNNSSSYALGVSLLAKNIVGQTGLQKSWPRYEKPLSTRQVTILQQRLTSMGYDTKGSDGVIGTNTRLAFQRWQADNGQTPDGFITQRSASLLLR